MTLLATVRVEKDLWGLPFLSNDVTAEDAKVVAEQVAEKNGKTLLRYTLDGNKVKVWML